MAQDLYWYYIQIIEDAVQAALDMSTKSIVQSYNDFDNDLLIDLKGNCLTASNALWNVICAFDMKVPVFKSTLRTCLTHLPELCRTLDRVVLLSSPSMPKTKQITNTGYSSVDFRATLIMEKCMQQLDEEEMNGKRKKIMPRR